ncbi:hypothetical protein J6590_054690 [Homalodisca vitripennis]|nr:hypothetical protein J6590_054690 [Homalodisca vitripennis]
MTKQIRQSLPNVYCDSTSRDTFPYDGQVAPTFLTFKVVAKQVYFSLCTMYVPWLLSFLVSFHVTASPLHTCVRCRRTPPRCVRLSLFLLSLLPVFIAGPRAVADSQLLMYNLLSTVNPLSVRKFRRV